MDEIIRLIPQERVQLNAREVMQLYTDLGPHGAEDVLCRAMADLAQRLQRCEALFRKGETQQLRKQARALAAVARQIGMASLAAVAGHLMEVVDRGDPVAQAATLARLLRLGAQSLREIWDLQDLSV